MFLVMATCGASIVQNGTYFVNPNHPNPTDSTGSCQITVPKLGPDVCQIRYINILCPTKERAVQ